MNYNLAQAIAAPPNLQRRRWLIAAFAPLVFFALGSDSAWLAARGGYGLVDGRLVSNVAATLYLMIMLGALRREQRIMVLIFVPFTAFGEFIFSIVFDWYAYKGGGIPFYIPVGHAVLFGTGMLVADSAWVVRRSREVRLALLLFHALLFGGAIAAFGDTLSAVLGALFAVVLIAYRGRLIYLIMGVLVLYVELLGTALGCWRWDPEPFGLLRTTNPPVGAFVCYVLADLLVLQTMTFARIVRAARRGSPLIGAGTKADFARRLTLAQMLQGDSRAHAPGEAEPAGDGPEDAYGQGYAVGTLGLAYSANGDSARAATCFERARSLARERGDAPVEALAGWHLGRELARGDAERERGLGLMQSYVDFLSARGHPEAAAHAEHLAALRQRTHDR